MATCEDFFVTRCWTKGDAIAYHLPQGALKFDLEINFKSCLKSLHPQQQLNKRPLAHISDFFSSRWISLINYQFQLPPESINELPHICKPRKCQCLHALAPARRHRYRDIEHVSNIS